MDCTVHLYYYYYYYYITPQSVNVQRSVKINRLVLKRRIWLNYVTYKPEVYFST